MSEFSAPETSTASELIAKPTLAILLKDPVLLLAFGFGSGLSPKAPGTAGSLVALALMSLLSLLPGWAFFLILVVASGLGVLICSHADRRLAGHDHSGIVWDEFVGLWIAVASVPATWGWWLAGFALFRCLDIFKPWPISVIDRKMTNGFGIMLDDILAGVGAWAILMIVMWLL